MRPFPLFVLYCLVLFASFASALGAGSLQLIVKPSTDPKVTKFDITIKVLDQTGKLVRHTIDVFSSRGARNAGCFTLLAKRGTETKSVKLTFVNATDTQINLRPELPASATAYNYFLIIQSNCIRLTPQVANNLSNHFEDVELPISAKDVSTDLRFIQPYPATQVALQQGSKVGAFSAALHYSHALNPSYDSLVHASLTADGSIRRDEEKHYLNKLEGEFGGYWTHNIAPSGLVEIGVSSKLQADRDFSTIDQTFGLNIWAWVPWFDSIAHAIFLTGDPTRPPFQAQPLFITGYDCVAHEKRNESSNSQYDGQNRLHGRLYWPIPIARQVPLLIVDRKLGVDLVVDVGGIFDLDNGRFAPDTKISIDLLLDEGSPPPSSGTGSPDKSKTASRPSITFSYVNGRVAPKFDSFNAFLAGLKYDF